VITHFAYGSNMSRAVMRKHAPGAKALGVAVLGNHRFLVTTDGYASVEGKRGAKVYGVLWRLTPRDYVTLAAWENIAAGLYRTAMLPVQLGAAGNARWFIWRGRGPRDWPRPTIWNL